MSLSLLLLLSILVCMTIFFSVSCRKNWLSAGSHLFSRLVGCCAAVVATANGMSRKRTTISWPPWIWCCMRPSLSLSAAYGLLHCTYDYVTLVWRWDARWNWLPASHPKWILFIHTLLRAMKITCYKRCEQRCKYSTRHVTLVLWVTNDWRHSKIRFLFLGNYSSLRAAQGWISVLLFSAVCSGRDIVAVGLSGSSERCVGNQKRLLTVMFLFCLPLCWTRKQIVSTSVGRNIFTGCLAYEFSIFLYFMFVTREYLFLKAESLCQFHGAHEWLRLRIEAKGTLMYFIHQ